MRKLCGWLPVLLPLMLGGCGADQSSADEYAEGPYRIRMERRADSTAVLRLYVDGERCDSLELPYPVYRFDCGDLTGNGIPELCVGVEKPTRYWPRGRRLFIYHLFAGRYIRPLWLGSRLGAELQDFRVCRDSVPACIHTVERKADGSAVRNEYRLFGFGLQFVKQH